MGGDGSDSGGGDRGRGNEPLLTPDAIRDWDGDAPIAAPLDVPARASVPPPPDLGAMFTEINQTMRPMPEVPTETSVPVFVDDLARAVTAPAPPARSPIDEAVLEALSREEVVRRSPPRSPSRTGSSTGRRPPPREGSRSRLPNKAPREYPVMRGLLRDPEALPEGSPDRPSSVEARAFIRSSPPRPPPREKASRAALDGMLEQMAEGLLVGGSGDALSEMRVTLRDEFFRGTELRIAVGLEGVTARFIPPDRDTYRHLSSELPRLRSHLADRGLKVGKLEVDEPE